MDIDLAKRRGRVSIFGQVRPESVIDAILVALTVARTRELRTVLFDFDRLALTRHPSLLEAHALAERMAHAGRGIGRTAFVVRAECGAAIDHLVNATNNRGLNAAAFFSEREAAAWLDVAAPAS